MKPPAVSFDPCELVDYSSGYADLPLEALGLLVHLRALYARELAIPDDPRAAAARCYLPAGSMIRHWQTLRGWFQPCGGDLVCPKVHRSIEREMSKAEKCGRASQVAWNQRRNDAAAIGHLKGDLKGDLVGDLSRTNKDRGRDAGAQAHTVGVLSTQKEKASESADAASHAAVGKMKKPRAPKASMPLTPKQLRDLSLQEFLWTGDHEAQLQEARKAYPSNRLRIFSDGTTTKCLPGTTEQTRKAWKEILIDHPEVTPRLLKLCLFAYLDQFDLDAKQGIQAGLVNLPTFWAPEKRMWEDWLEVARRNQAEFDAQAQGRLPLEMEA